jgi:predicted dehydrogenase
MKILIAGLGSIGRRHLRNLLLLGEQDILLYRSKQSTLPEEELEQFPVFLDLEEALAQKPEAVVISNPTSLHLDVAIPAARQGCHLLLEKPVSHSFERIAELEKAVNENGSRVLVGFQFRFHPGLQNIARMLREEVLGRPLWARAHWGEHLEGWHPWEDYRQSYSARKDLGGGVINTLCHPLDYCGWFFGKAYSVCAVRANLSDLELGGVEDCADIALNYENGSAALIHLDYFQRPPSHTLHITCENGIIEWDNQSGAVFLKEAGSSEPVVFPIPEGFDRNTMFLDEMKHFLSVIRGDVEPVCSLSEGIETLKLTCSVHTSALEKRVIDRDQFSPF